MISIIIPTYNRAETLSKTLYGYLKQTYLSSITEIIVIDDGSTDQTKAVVADILKVSTIPILYIYQKNLGPAKARNKGIKSASGSILLFTGDDIVPNSRLIEMHYFSHEANNFNNRIAVLGKTIWPTEWKITPFMKHIQENGLQFGYSLIKDEQNIPFTFFYTSNISLYREVLLEGKLFDTDFPYAAWEDIELSYRLMKRDIKIIFNGDAIGYHYHRISFSSFRKRQEICGISAHIFYRKHPELADLLKMNTRYEKSFFITLKIKIITLFCLISEKLFPFKFPKLYDKVMNYHYLIGIQTKKDIFQ